MTTGSVTGLFAATGSSESWMVLNEVVNEVMNEVMNEVVNIESGLML